MELPETDKAVEAREARRRRLLEKSNARLGLITGREHNEVIPEPIVHNGIYSDPDFERDVYEAPTNLAAFNPETQDIFELLKTMQGTNSPFMPTDPSQPATPPVPETPTSRFIRSKYPIVILALIVYMLFAFGLDFLVGGAVFSSLIVWEIAEFFLTTFVIKQPVQQGGLVNILFMFGGISAEQTQIILKVLGLVNKIIRDIAIFMFTFVMLHLSWSFFMLGESLTEILDKDFSNLLKSDELSSPEASEENSHHAS